MRKRILSSTAETTSDAVRWLDLESVADVEITSEDPARPIESALLPGEGPGWRAAGPGPQTIRLTFAQPQTLSRIELEFSEPSVERTQEYVLRWSGDRGSQFQDVVRQQWNFAPSGSTHQSEEHNVNLAGVTVLELEITPEIGGGNAVASLDALRLA